MKKTEQPIRYGRAGSIQVREDVAPDIPPPIAANKGVMQQSEAAKELMRPKDADLFLTILQK